VSSQPLYLKGSTRERSFYIQEITLPKDVSKINFQLASFSLLTLNIKVESTAWLDEIGRLEDQWTIVKIFLQTLSTEGYGVNFLLTFPKNV
jgi:hypothetical protein